MLKVLLLVYPRFGAFLIPVKCQHGLQMSFLGPVYIVSAVNIIETPI